MKFAVGRALVARFEVAKSITSTSRYLRGTILGVAKSFAGFSLVGH
jgi:hypothetical protein